MICHKCKKDKNISQYFRSKRNKSGILGTCKDCVQDSNRKWRIKKYGSVNGYHKEYCNKIQGGNPGVIYSKKKCNAKSNGIEFLLKRDEFISWYKEQPRQCTYCGLPEHEISRLTAYMPNTNTHRLTLDRIDSSKGYEIGNICLSCARCNLIKSDFFTSSEMKEVAEKYVRPKWNKLLGLVLRDRRV